MNKIISEKYLYSILNINLYNLKYLNIANNNISNEGLKCLENKSLVLLEYLNISKNKIDDEGLKYLIHLSNLKELIILEMKLSDKCFLVLENFKFYSTINNIECDKQSLSISLIYNNFIGFKLKNLSSLKFECKYKINHYLHILFSSNKICSSLKILDLSNTGITDNEVLTLKLNISKMKNIEVINLENNELTIEIQNYLKYFNDLNIKIIIDETKLMPEYIYKIILIGSTISSKTCYLTYCKEGKFPHSSINTIGINYIQLNPSFSKSIKVRLFDTCQCRGKFDEMIKNYIPRANGILLLFDVTSKEDFDGLNIIINDLELYNYPVLLIANKIDLNNERVINKEDIEKFQKDNKLIGYFEVSCKNGINVKESFDFLVKYIIDQENNI